MRPEGTSFGAHPEGISFGAQDQARIDEKALCTRSLPLRGPAYLSRFLTQHCAVCGFFNGLLESILNERLIPEAPQPEFSFLLHLALTGLIGAFLFLDLFRRVVSAAVRYLGDMPAVPSLKWFTEFIEF